MRTVVLTGGTGFVGYGLLTELLQNDVFVYAVVRRNSKRLSRLEGLKGIKIIELDMNEIENLPHYVSHADAFYHLAWEGERNDYNRQLENVTNSVMAMQVAKQLGAKQVIVTGSQAEYGIQNSVIDESTVEKPNTAYGACKLACYHILSTLSEQMGICLTWVRIFSVFGVGDNPNTLISYLQQCFKSGETPSLTSGNHIWDYLYLKDAAKALYLLGENEKDGIYNLASGDYRQLKEYICELRDYISPHSELCFNNVESSVQLITDISKIKQAINWSPNFTFREALDDMCSDCAEKK